MPDAILATTAAHEKLTQRVAANPAAQGAPVPAGREILRREPGSRPSGSKKRR